MKHVEQRIRGLAKQVQTIRGQKSGFGLRWPEEFKSRAILVMTEGKISSNKFSKAIGISAQTLRVWRAGSKSKLEGDGFRALKVVNGPKVKIPARSPVKIFVTTSQGSEILVGTKRW